MDIASFGLAKIELFLLVLSRTAGIFTLVPIFGTNQTPPHVRVGVAISLALVFVPLCAPVGTGLPTTDLLPMLLLLTREALVGLVIGFATTLIFEAIQAGGHYVDMHSGFSMATLFDPVYGSPGAVASHLNRLLAGLLFFVTNAHHIMLAGLADSFRILPVGQMGLNPAAAGGVLELMGPFFAIAIRIAAPAVAAVLLADVALAVIARGVPQMNVFIVGLPLKLGIGLIGMLISLPVVIALSRDAFGDIGRQTAWLLKLLAS